MVIAMMAVQMTRLLMDRHARVTVIAVSQPATIVALKCGGITPAVNKYQNLMARLDFRGDSFQGVLRETFMQGLRANIK